jgi:hypothetical protein
LIKVILNPELKKQKMHYTKEQIAQIEPMNLLLKRLEDTKWVIRSRNLKKKRQYNGSNAKWTKRLTVIYKPLHIKQRR